MTELEAVSGWLDSTDAIALKHFDIGVAARIKADGTEVTQADREIETALREAIEKNFPGDAILGEEEGLTGQGPRRWIIDPIDATTNYVRGIPVFATLVALEDEAGLVLGLASAPALGARWWAGRGNGAFRDGRPIRVSATDRVESMHLATGDIALFDKHHLGAPLRSVLERVRRHRGFGDFWGHMLVAQGSVDAMIDPVVSAWDLAAVKIIVEEAGGRATSIDGNPRYDAGSFVTSNGLVHDSLLAAFAD